MGRRTALGLSLLVLCLALAACGSDSLLLSMGRTASDIDVISIPDGQVIAAGTPVTVHLASRSAETQQDLELTAALTVQAASPAGSTGAAGSAGPAQEAARGATPAAQAAAAWKGLRLTAPAMNEDIPLALPDLPPGTYQLEVAVLSGGEQVARRVSTFFVVRGTWEIAAIKSFPPVLTADSTVLLRAELAVPDGADPWLRWTWKDTVIGRGRASAGAAQALWTAPGEEGVYSIHLELFPGAPVDGADFAFASSIVRSTDLFVTAAARLGWGDLSPDSSYHTLLHLQGNLRDSGAAAARPPRAVPSTVGSPEVVQAGDGFGYRFDGTSGISIPWLALPVHDGVLGPFTVTVGITPESLDAEQALLAAASADGELSLRLWIDPVARAPAAQLAASGQPPLAVPWKGPELQKGARAAVSLSVLPGGGRVQAAWFLDGIQVSRFSADLALPDLEPGGKTLLAGEKGFVGTVDELGVYVRDAAGRPSTDPGLFARAARAGRGDGVVLAEGFDGPFLPDGFSASAGAAVEQGSLVLPAGESVDLSPLAVPAEQLAFTARLSEGSGQLALLGLSWEGSASPALEVPLAAEAGTLSFTLAAGAQSLGVAAAGGRARTVKIPPGPGAESRLVLRLSVPPDAKQPLVVESVLAERQREP